MNIGKIICDYLFNDEMKAKIVKELNDAVNIPIINEKTEEKVLDAIYEVIEQVIKKVMLKGA